MKTKQLLYAALGAIALFLISSCADTGYYGYGGGSYGGGYYGSSLTTLPYGYTRIYVGSVPYYYHGNRWYRRSGGRYVVCARPHGYHGSLGRHSARSHRGRTPGYSSRSSYYRNKYRRSSSPSIYRNSTYRRGTRPSTYKRSGSRHSSYRSSPYRSSLRSPHRSRSGGIHSPHSTRYNASSRSGTRPRLNLTPRSGRGNSTPRITPRATPTRSPGITPRARGNRGSAGGRRAATFVRSGGSSGSPANIRGTRAARSRGAHRRAR